VTTRAAADAAVNAPALLARVVEHYHQTFCTRREGQAYLATRGLTEPTLLKTFQMVHVERGGELLLGHGLAFAQRGEAGADLALGGIGGRAAAGHGGGSSAALSGGREKGLDRIC
jgi:hypothetical protein